MRTSMRNKPKALPPGKTRPEKCMLCRKVFPRVTSGHLRQHGFTVARYERMYGVRCLPDASEAIDVGSVSDPNPALMSAVADRLSEDKTWLACISDEVGERMLTGPLKQRMGVLITTMLYQRAGVHGQAMTILSGALEELNQEWRLAQGGDDHGPTDTGTLLGIVERAAKLVKDSEEAVHRTMKLALDEQRNAAEFADAAGAPLYTGSGEALNMPTGVTTGDREIIRALMGMIGKHATEANTLDAEHGPVTAAPPTPSPQGDPPTTPSSGEGSDDMARDATVMSVDIAPHRMPPLAPPTQVPVQEAAASPLPSP